MDDNSNFYPAEFYDHSGAENILAEIRNNVRYFDDSDSEESTEDLVHVGVPCNSTTILSPSKEKENLSDTIVNNTYITVEPDQLFSRKRGVRNPAEMKQNVRKKRCQSGKQCVNEGCCSSPKSLKNLQDCKEKCRYKCNVKINDEERNRIFVDFYDNRDKNRQYDETTWNDSCVPQNRNQMISYAMLEIIRNNDHLNSITMRYSVPGHSYIQKVDNMHSKIEHAMSTAEFYSPVFFWVYYEIGSHFHHFHNFRI